MLSMHKYLKDSICFLFYFLIGINLASSQICYDTGNFTTNSTYDKNRGLLLSSLASNVNQASGRFYNTTVGQDPDKVYGLVLCRPDTSPEDCSSCVNSGIKDVTAGCPNQKEAILWAGAFMCVVRYSNRSIFEKLELNPSSAGYNTGKLTVDLQEFDKIWESLVGDLITKASVGSSNFKYATGEANLTNLQTIYALMQCTPDISRSDCRECLRQSAAEYQTCCHGYQGGFVARPSCVFRWDLYSFYESTNTTATKGINLASSAQTCYDTGNFTTNSTYDKNRGRLLSSLASNVNQASGRFYNTTVGQDPDKVYGLALCRPYTSPEDCSICANAAINLITVNCPNQKEAIIWSGEPTCVVRYSNRSIFEKLELYPHDAFSNSGLLTVDLQEFDKMWESLVRDLRTKASVGSSNLKYATGEANLTNLKTIYASMQCSPDISQSDCNECLRISAVEYQTCCHGNRGGLVFRPSCVFRWELYPFYKSVHEAPIPSPSVNKTTTNKKENGSIASTTIVIIVVALVIFVTVVVVAFSCILCHRRKPKQDVDGEEDLAQLPLFDLVTIESATKKFSYTNKIGQGGFGPVYKGQLATGQEVAVKRLSKDSGQGLTEFKNEVIFISRLQHRNLVRLLGCCIHGEERMLVYEYMPKGSLDRYLYNQTKATSLDWQLRFHIIVGIARGLLYLHRDSRLRIIHRDLKAGNILLDGEMNPKISDFGLARTFGGDQNAINTNRVVGTYGYMSPEYVIDGLFSIKSDVFSFGVLVLEIVSGNKNRGFYHPDHDLNLLGHSWRLWVGGRQMELIDPLMEKPASTSELLKCIHIGLLCVQQRPENRPNMSSIVLMLDTENPILPQPKQPGFYTERSVTEVTASKSYTINEVTNTMIQGR